MFEEGSFRRRPRGFRRKCQTLNPMYRMMGGIGFGTPMLQQNFDFQSHAGYNSYNIDLIGNAVSSGYDGHHIPHMASGSAPPYLATCQVPAGGGYGPESSSSPLQPSSSSAMGNLDCQSPHTNWTSATVPSYIKHQSLAASSPVPAGHTAASSYSLEQNYVPHSARDSPEIQGNPPSSSVHLRSLDAFFQKSARGFDIRI